MESWGDYFSHFIYRVNALDAAELAMYTCHLAHSDLIRSIVRIAASAITVGAKASMCRVLQSNCHRSTSNVLYELSRACTTATYNTCHKYLPYVFK